MKWMWRCGCEEVRGGWPRFLLASETIFGSELEQAVGETAVDLDAVVAQDAGQLVLAVVKLHLTGKPDSAHLLEVRVHEPLLESRQARIAMVGDVLHDALGGRIDPNRVLELRILPKPELEYLELL